MNFLRNNIFVVGLIGIVVVIAGSLLFAYNNISGDNQKLIQERMDISKELSRLGSKPYVNARAINAMKSAVVIARSNTKEVIDSSIAWNNRHYGVLQLPKFDRTGRITERVDAFPIVEENAQYNMRFWFVTEYHHQLVAMLKDMGAITPPTEEDVERAVDIANGRIHAREARRLRRERAAAGDEGTSPETTPGGNPELLRPGGGLSTRRGSTPASRGRAAPTRGAGRDMREAGMMMDRMGAREGARATPARGARARSARAGATDQTNVISDEAQQSGFDTAKVLQSRKGPIYADLRSLHIVLDKDENTTNVPDTQLWEAQESLWITGDILAAISQTINDTLTKRTTGNGQTPIKATVPNSPIKHLLNITIQPGYITGPTDTRTTRRSGGSTISRRTRTEAPARGGGMRGRDDDFRGMGGGRLGPPSGGLRGTQSARGGGSSGPRGAGSPRDTLTRRVSNTMYDVKHYSFSVIMDPRHLPALEKNLLALNYHTVLSVNMETVVQPENDMYYYGTTGVMQVTIQGELLLLTDWVRGTWIPGKKRGEGHWSSQRPPLMPKDVLIGLQNTSALREEDQKRLSAQ